METKYIKVDWPEYQTYMNHPYFRELSHYLPDINSYMIPEGLINDIDSGIYFPNIYENTNLGTITGYENYILVNGEEKFEYRYPQKGEKVLVCLNNPEKWEITTCIANSYGMPILLENKLHDGINCQIVGAHE